MSCAMSYMTLVVACLFVSFYIGVDGTVNCGFLILFLPVLFMLDIRVIVDSILVKLSVSNRESGLTREALIVSMRSVGNESERYAP